MNIEELSALLAQPTKPCASWQPTQCGTLPITINTAGVWFYDGSEITRPAMVKLFASVLCKEENQFYLKTPIEKIAIVVEDAPFLITTWRFAASEQGRVLCCIDNLQRTWLVRPQHPITLAQYRQNEQVPYLNLPNGCSARVARNVVYQWSAIAEQDGRGYYLCSAGERYYIYEHSGEY